MRQCDCFDSSATSYMNRLLEVKAIDDETIIKKEKMTPQYSDIVVYLDLVPQTTVPRHVGEAIRMTKRLKMMHSG